MSIILTIIPYIVILLLSICVKKLFEWLLPKIEKVISPLLLCPCMLLGIYTLFNTSGFFDFNNNKLEWVASFVLAMLFAVLAAILYLFESAGKIISKQTSFPKFIGCVFLVIASLSLNFAIQYFIIYSYDETLFNLHDASKTFILAEFFFYSFGLMLNTSISNIEPASLLVKLIASLEVISSFTVLVIVLANYQELGKLYRQDKNVVRKSPKGNKSKKDNN